MTPLRDSLARAIAEAGGLDPDEICPLESMPWWWCSLREADAVIAHLDTVLTKPTLRVVQAAVSGWLDTALMSGAIAQAWEKVKEGGDGV